MGSFPETYIDPIFFVFLYLIDLQYNIVSVTDITEIFRGKSNFIDFVVFRLSSPWKYRFL